MYFHVVMLICS